MNEALEAFKIGVAQSRAIEAEQKEREQAYERWVRRMTTQRRRPKRIHVRRVR